ncbi:MAG: hypothetical protein ABWX74_04300 [Aeromicrobium sp.]
MFSEFAVARDAAEADALDGVSADDRALLLDILAKIANRHNAALTV